MSVLTPAAAPAYGGEQASPTDTARFLAGMHPSPQSPLAPLTQERGWQQHADTLNAIWAGLDAQQLSKIRAWSRANLKDRKPVTYYPFSGPDFLYADAFFPDASTYILAGLEPAGQNSRRSETAASFRRDRPCEAQNLTRHLAEDELFHHERDGCGPQRQRTARHTAAAVRVPGTHRKDDPRGEPRRSRARRKPAIGGRFQERRTRGQDRLLGQRRQAANALLLQDRPQQSRRPEQRLPAVLRAVRHRRCFHQGCLLPSSQRRIFDRPQFPARPRRLDGAGRYRRACEIFPAGRMGSSAIRPVCRADPHLQGQLSIKTQRPVCARQSRADRIRHRLSVAHQSIARAARGEQEAWRTRHQPPGGSNQENRGEEECTTGRAQPWRKRRRSPTGVRFSWAAWSPTPSSACSGCRGLPTRWVSFCRWLQSAALPGWHPPTSETGAPRPRRQAQSGSSSLSRLARARSRLRGLA